MILDFEMLIFFFQSIQVGEDYQADIPDLSTGCATTTTETTASKVFILLFGYLRIIF